MTTKVYKVGRGGEPKQKRNRGERKIREGRVERGGIRGGRVAERGGETREVEGWKR